MQAMVFVYGHDGYLCERERVVWNTFEGWVGRGGKEGG